MVPCLWWTIHGFGTELIRNLAIWLAESRDYHLFIYKDTLSILVRDNINNKIYVTIQILWKKWVCSQSHYYRAILTKFSTWHESCDFVACSNISRKLTKRDWVARKENLGRIVSEKLLEKLSPLLNANCWNKQRSNLVLKCASQVSGGHTV